MKKQIEILRADLQPGDFTVTANQGNQWILVEREVEEPEPEIMTPEYEADILREFLSDWDCATVGPGMLEFTDSDIKGRSKRFLMTITEVEDD